MISECGEVTKMLNGGNSISHAMDDNLDASSLNKRVIISTQFSYFVWSIILVYMNLLK